MDFLKSSVLILALALSLIALSITFKTEKLSQTEIIQNIPIDSDELEYIGKDTKISVEENSPKDIQEDFSADSNESIDYVTNYSKIYLDNISKAYEGDSIAQYRVSYALKYCTVINTIKSLSDIEKMVEAIFYDQMWSLEREKYILAMKAEFSVCKDIIPHIQDKNVITLNKAWLERAANEGHPIAKLEILLERDWELKNPEDPMNPIWQPKPLKVKPEEVRNLIYKALAFSNQGKIERENAFSLAGFYKGELVGGNHNMEAWVNHSSGAEGAYAWMVLACKNSTICSGENDMKSYFENHLFPYQISEIMDKAEEYSHAIQSENWEALELY